MERIKYTHNQLFLMRKRARARFIPQSCMENKLYSDSKSKLTGITTDERDYIRGWCSRRYVEDSYAVRAIIFWMRVKSSLSVFFMLKPTNKMIYMILCIHISMKWQGYTETHKCDFLGDLKKVDPELSTCNHQEMEYHVITNLNWEFGP